MPGRYTREGDVRELVAARPTTCSSIARPGDEMALAFDATACRRCRPAGRARSSCYADGYSKEMDIHSASPDERRPLPFHAMTRYPYAAAGAVSRTRRRIARYPGTLATRAWSSAAPLPPHCELARPT